jgi:hypothetical protein
LQALEIRLQSIEMRTQEMLTVLKGFTAALQNKLEEKK